MLRLFIILAFSICTPIFSQNDPAKSPPAKSVSDLTAEARKSLVTVSHSGRGNTREGSGTGFAISKDLIATCLHVIGEARAIKAQTWDGKELTVLAIHASDRKRDLAILKIKDGNLTPLPLGDSASLLQGESVIALGNPMGLTGSVVEGVLSARRDMELGKMLQLAIPVEPGNSGGPVLDLQGRVQGIMTMKSTVTANLGFAMPVNFLKPLITKPNPVPMDRWLTIGALNSKEWEPLMGAQWRQRAGRITVKESGSGFGGRSLCLSHLKAPELPYELEVMVKLNDEAGAAGLVFSSDGKEKHYGFYPTGGKLRLTRFDGPSVFSWTILKDADSPHYKPGEWNTLKVRHEPSNIHCFVNDQKVFTVKDDGLKGGRVGLTKFRETEAEFRQFRHGTKLASLTPPAELLEKLEQEINTLEPSEEFSKENINRLKTHAGINQSLLRKRAEILETQARQLRWLAAKVHERATQEALTKELEQDEPKIDLLRAALLIARLDNGEIEIEHYLKTVDDMATTIQSALKPKATEKDKLEAVGRYMFEQSGFHGSRGDYYNRANSYLNEVIDDREGIPITLAVLYMEIVNRLGIPLQGLPLPGHFAVGKIENGKPTSIIDVYDGAKVISRKEAEELVFNTSGVRLRDEHFQPATKQDMIVRMLRNLIGVSNTSEEPATVVRYLDTLLLLEPNSPQERLNRALMHMKQKKNAKAKEDVRWLLENDPPGFNRERLLDLFRRL